MYPPNMIVKRQKSRKPVAASDAFMQNASLLERRNYVSFKADVLTVPVYTHGCCLLLFLGLLTECPWPVRANSSASEAI